MSTPSVAAIERIVGGGGDADDVLRAAVAELVRAPGIEWAAVFFLEGGELELGPEAGSADASRRACVPVTYQGVPVGELAVDGDADAGLLERVAALLSAHVLLGWDTGGEAWEP